jgi:FHA domain
MLAIYNRILLDIVYLKTQLHKILCWHCNFGVAMLTPISLFISLLVISSMGSASPRGLLASGLINSTTIPLALYAGFGPFAAPQDYGRQDSLDSLKDEWNGMVRKENFPRQLSFAMLQPYLPPGTQMTSGYRSPQDQLGLIRRLARAHNIPTPTNMDVNDRNSWWQTLLAVRDKGYIVAAPTTTPHATSEVVFDMSGANLSAIEAGCRRAERDGIVQFKKVILEPQNNALHVEIDKFNPKALMILGTRRAIPSAQAGQGARQPPKTEAERRQQALQGLQDLHDTEPDPAKKIDYDRQMKFLLDPNSDSDKIRSLDEEIKEHEEKSQQLGSETDKRKGIDKISAALRDGSIGDAEREAENLLTEFPDSQDAKRILSQVRAQRFVIEAQDALDKSGCDDCEMANQLIDSALKLSPNHKGAKQIKQDVEARLSNCALRRVLMIAFGLASSAVVAIILLYFSRSKGWNLKKITNTKQWALEAIEGPCKGQVFPLEKQELTIGAAGPPDGTSDIVICDEQHKISRRHCVILHNGKQFYLMDESTNGTKINEQEIEKGAWAEFHKGDVISLADESVLMLRQV